MIRPLRRAHRRIVLVLAIALPLIVTIALVLRPDLPLERRWPFTASAFNTRTP